MMAELPHLAQSFINAEDAIIDKRKKKAEWVEVGYIPHPKHGPCPKKARTGVDASSQFGHPSRQCSTRTLESYGPGSSGAMKEGYTSGVCMENESILFGLPKLGEVATNHWVFSKL